MRALIIGDRKGMRTSATIARSRPGAPATHAIVPHTVPVCQSFLRTRLPICRLRGGGFCLPNGRDKLSWEEYTVPRRCQHACPPPLSRTGLPYLAEHTHEISVGFV